MNHQKQQQFYKLLRLSLGLTQEFPVEVDADGWRRLYQTATISSGIPSVTETGSTRDANGLHRGIGDVCTMQRDYPDS